MCFARMIIRDTQNTCKKIVYLSNTVKEKQWDDFTHPKVVVLTKEER